MHAPHHAQKAAPVPVLLVIMRRAAPAAAATCGPDGLPAGRYPAGMPAPPRYAPWLLTDAIKCTAYRRARRPAWRRPPDRFVTARCVSG